MKLRSTKVSVIIFSTNHEKLAKWYETILGFKVRSKIDMPHEHFIDFDFGDTFFSVGHHGKLKGKTKDPYRIMVGFDVNSVTQIYEELKDKPVTFIAKPFEAPPGGY